MALTFVFYLPLLLCIWSRKEGSVTSVTLPKNVPFHLSPQAAVLIPGGLELSLPQ